MEKWSIRASQIQNLATHMCTNRFNPWFMCSMKLGIDLVIYHMRRHKANHFFFFLLYFRPVVSISIKTEASRQHHHQYKAVATLSTTHRFESDRQTKTTQRMNISGFVEVNNINIEFKWAFTTTPSNFHFSMVCVVSTQTILVFGQMDHRKLIRNQSDNKYEHTKSENISHFHSVTKLVKKLRVPATLPIALKFLSKENDPRNVGGKCDTLCRPPIQSI